MSDASEKEWTKTGRPSGPQGETKSGLSHGLVSNEQIKSSMTDMGMGHGQGQRPVSPSMSSTKRGGKNFKFK